MSRYSAEPVWYKSSFVPAFDSYTGIGPNPGDLWVDMTIPVVKRMVSRDPDVWVSIEGAGGGGGTGPTFSDDETPSGAINDVNVTYGLAIAPSPVGSLQLYRNGGMLRRTLDYTISGATITMTTAPVTGDSIKAWYRSAGAAGGPTFADDETPTGAINDANVTYSLAFAPSPASSLQLFRNDLLQRRGIDYTLSGATITMTTAPVTGDSLKAWYRR